MEVNRRDLLQYQETISLLYSRLEGQLTNGEKDLFWAAWGIMHNMLGKEWHCPRELHGLDEENQTNQEYLERFK